VGWKLDVRGLPKGYQAIEGEDGVTLLGPQGGVVAQFGPMLSTLETVVAAAWDDARPTANEELQPV
jgi:hypothetical protein